MRKELQKFANVNKVLAVDKNSNLVYKSSSDVVTTWGKYGFVAPSKIEGYVFGKGTK